MKRKNALKSENFLLALRVKYLLRSLTRLREAFKDICNSKIYVLRTWN